MAEDSLSFIEKNWFGSAAAPFANLSVMSAFPESGRSDRQKLGEIRVRFRPRADVEN
jgi:hypothetical protein